MYSLLNRLLPWTLSAISTFVFSRFIQTKVENITNLRLKVYIVMRIWSIWSFFSRRMSNSAERRLLRDLRKMQNDPPQAVVVTDELFLYQSMLIFLLWNSWKSWWVKKAVTYNTDRTLSDVSISQLIWSLLFLFPTTNLQNSKQ